MRVSSAAGEAGRRACAPNEVERVAKELQGELASGASVPRAKGLVRRAATDIAQKTLYKTVAISPDAHSLPLRIAAMTRGLRRPCITATTHKPFSCGVKSI